MTPEELIEKEAGVLWTLQSLIEAGKHYTTEELRTEALSFNAALNSWGGCVKVERSPKCDPCEHGDDCGWCPEHPEQRGDQEYVKPLPENLP